MKVPLDFKHFKKVASDDKSTTLMHPKGHKIMIAHAALDKGTQAKLNELPHYYDGGGPGYSQDQSSNEQKSGKDINININAGQPQATPQALPPPPAPVTPEPTPYVQPGNVPPGIPSPTPTPPVQPEMPVSQPQVSQAPMASAPAQDQGMAQPTSPQQSQDQGMAQPTSPQQSQDQGMAQPTSPQQSQDQFGLNALTNNYMKGIEEQKQGLTGEAKATGELGKERAGIVANQSSELQKRYSTYEDNMNQLMQERQGLLADIKSGHIDPTKYMSDKSLGGKLATAIGLIAGGIGGALTHQENPALKFLNANIDRDIEAQKTNLGKSQSLLGANLQNMGNMRDAMTMTKVMMNDMASLKLQEASDKAQDPIAKARLMQEKGKLDYQNAPLLQQMTMRKTLMNNMSQPENGQDKMGQYINSLRFADPKQAEEMSKRYVPGVGMSTIEIPNDERLKISAAQHLDDQYNKLLAFSKAHSGSLDPEITKQGETLAKGVQDAMRQASGAGVYKEGEAHFINAMASDNPTAFFAKYRVQPGYKQSKIDNLSRLKSLKKTYGLPVVEGKVQGEGWE